MHHLDALRPHLHFTAGHGWLNDPNGLVRVGDEYHLFFQHNPFGDLWGNMSWGHAVSTDLLRWTELPVALEPYPTRTGVGTTMIFSGSAIEDDDGLLRAYYTAHERLGDEPLNESVALAVSPDAGRTWQFHCDNPLLDTGRRDFRDPKVFRWGAERRWVMAIGAAAQQAVEFYSSSDGLRWRFTGVFEASLGEGALWECPDLFEAAVDGTEERRWVLLASTAHGEGLPFTGMQYWVGDFDGATFTPDGPARTFDHGRDCFAGVTFNGLDRSEDPVLIAWASDWAYASTLPSQGWRGLMTLPRSLSLRHTPAGLLLAQRPVPQYDSVVGSRLAPGEAFRRADVRFRVPVGGAGGVRLRSGDDEWVDVTVEAGCLLLDRRRSGCTDLPPGFAACDTAPLPGGGAEGDVDVHVIADHCVVEVFACDGLVAMTHLVVPSGEWRLEVLGAVDGLVARAAGGEVAP